MSYNIKKSLDYFSISSKYHGWERYIEWGGFFSKKWEKRGMGEVERQKQEDKEHAMYFHWAERILFCKRWVVPAAGPDSDERISGQVVHLLGCADAQSHYPKGNICSLTRGIIRTYRELPE